MPDRRNRAPTKETRKAAIRNLQTPEAGERLKRAIHVARATTDVTSDMELARQAGVHYDTLMNWFSGRTTPRPFEVRKVGEVLGIGYGELLAAYEGRPAPAVPLEQAVADLIAEIRIALVDERHARAELMRAIASSIAVAISAPPSVGLDPAEAPDLARNGNGH